MSRFKITILVLFVGVLVYYVTGKDQKQEMQASSEENAKEKSEPIVDLFGAYPSDVIPYQIRNSDYVLHVRLKGIKTTILKNAFVKSHDDYTVDSYQDGMNVKIQFTMKNPYEREMWVPIPMSLDITSNEYPKEENTRNNGIHPHQDYSSNTLQFVDKEPTFKRNAFNDQLYYIPAGGLIQMEAEFRAIPFTPNIIVCGLSITQNDNRYEKGLLINIKQNSIIGQEIFKYGYYRD